MKKWCVSNLLVVALSFQSCFQIVEDVEIFENGSGKMELKLNMSESRNKLNTVMTMDSINGYKIPSKVEINNKLKEVGNIIGKIHGISNVNTNMDYNNFIMTLKFNFADVNQINKAMDVIMQQYKIHNASKPTYTYNKATKRFTRTYMTVATTLKEFNKLKAEDKKIFDKASYTAVYRFSNPVNSSSNNLSQLSPNKKAVKQDAKLLDILNNKTSINQILIHN